MSLGIVFLLAGIIILAALLLVFISIKKGVKPLDVEYFRTKCLEIEHQLKPDDQASCHFCVLNGDNLVDRALKNKGFKGKTMGDRLKNAKSFLSNNNDVWTAHKIRNKIAHEPNVRIEYKDARFALNAYRKALKDLGAI